MKNDNLFSGINAVIFDMDGLIIDSEPYWKIAEKTVFGKLGLNLTDDLLREVMGFRLSEVVTHWYNYQPWNNPDFDKTENDILECVEELIKKHAEAMPGVIELIHELYNKQYKLAVASSSAMRLILTVLHKLNIRNLFEVIHSAEFEVYGKPHPAIFITAANMLQVSTQQCLVFEDSINGVLAAKAARMRCVAVPEAATFNDARFAIADCKVATLVDLI